MQISCIIVFYNLECENSITIKSILKTGINKLNVIVCDNSINSVIKNSNEKFCNEQHIQYLDMGGNVGLSKAYNKALKEINMDNWVVIFDQDTKISREYFDKLIISINQYPEVYMHVPIVKSKKIQMSPSLSNGYGIKEINLINSGIYKDITAINSGMTIRRDVFKKIGEYNEKIFLDYLDHYFVREYKKYYDEIAVFDCILIQEFSNDDHSDLNRDLSRFEIYTKDFYEYCQDSIKGRIYYFLKIIYRSIKLSIIHKNFKFIKIIIQRRNK